MDGKRLKKLREANNLTLKQLGKILNLSDSTVSLYESNKRIPNDDIKKDIANYFGVTVDYLIGRTDDPIGAILTYRTKEEEALIRELKGLGVEYITVLKDAYDNGITAKELRKVLEFVKNLKKDKGL